MNVDWFKPFAGGKTYSVGAIYLTIQNLPRNERYLRENIILVGLLPGPKEPSLTMNSYLTPLVKELLELWHGVIITLKIPNSLPISIRIKAALSCCACDIPASKKVCGFLAHSATLGCNKCLKQFSHYQNSNGKPCTDYSGFDRESWSMRNSDIHRQKADELLKEKTITSLKEAETTYSLRYSVLLSLPYFDPIQFTVIDPMHNIYLGTGKHAFKVWVQNNLITKRDMIKLEEQMENFVVPSNAGRLPTTISSGYGGFTANQWSNWITFYSPIVLKGILPDEHYRCWLLFVRACALLKPRFLRKCDIDSADLLLQFCKEFQRLYGPQSITPNMHTHLKQCIIDFSPLHAFWCYPFERYNGVLGSFHSSRKLIESQLMKKFCQSQIYTESDVLPADIVQFLPAYKRDHDNNRRSSDSDVLKFIQVQSSPLRFVSSFALLHGQTLVKPLSPHRKRVLSEPFSAQLLCIYKQLYPTRQIAHMPYFYSQYGRVCLSGDIIGCSMSGANSHSSSMISAFWPGRGSSLSAVDNISKSIGVVQYFVLHTVELYTDSTCSETERLQHVFCYVKWQKRHPKANWFWCSAVVCCDSFEIPDACNFMPIQRVVNKCAYVKVHVNFDSYDDSVLVVCPLPIKY